MCIVSFLSRTDLYRTIRHDYETKDKWCVYDEIWNFVKASTRAVFIFWICDHHAAVKRYITQAIFSGLHFLLTQNMPPWYLDIVFLLQLSLDWCTLIENVLYCYWFHDKQLKSFSLRWKIKGEPVLRCGFQDHFYLYWCNS